MHTTHTIPAKMAGTGSIHDIASEHGDRVIRFAPGCIYAVVCASYYGGKGYTTHSTAAAAVAASKRLGDYSHRIISVDGIEYMVAYDDLVPA